MNLGHTYKDVITGFSGVCVGFAQYLTGCSQALLQPPSGAPDKRPESEWFDVQRLQAITSVAPITLNNGATPGADKPAPKC